MKGLLEEYSDDFLIMNKTTEDDGYGGYKIVWTEGATIRGALAPASQQEVTVADAMGEKTTHTLVIDKSLVLDYHDVIKRVRDGQYFRVTSSGGDTFTPANSSLDLRKVTLEKWELSDG